MRYKNIVAQELFSVLRQYSILNTSTHYAQSRSIAYMILPGWKATVFLTLGYLVTRHILTSCYTRERGGSLLKHPHVVFLDVEELALTLAPILNHKMKQGDASHAYFSVERKPREGWISRARDRLISEGILEARFARLLWKSDGIDMPQQAFDVLVKLGILLPLPRSHESGVDDVLPKVWGNTSLWEHVEEFLVLMRLPLKASCETTNRFNVMEQLREEWGVVARWEFDHGRAPHGLVERLVASCHAIGNMVTGTCWRGGACFFAHETSRNAAGGYFALALHFTQRINLNRPTAGILVVQAFGHRDGRAVWGALRFIISSVWDLFKEFPGLGWQAWVECPKHHGQVQHYLAGPDDSKVRATLVFRGFRLHILVAVDQFPMRCGTFASYL